MLLMHCDKPNDERIDVNHSFIEIAGWAISDEKIKTIKLLLNNEFIANAVYGLRRPDVHKVYPKIEGSELSGFWYEIDLRNLSCDSYVLKIEIVSGMGKRKSIEKIIKKNLNKTNSKPNQCYLCKSEHIVERVGWYIEKYQLIHCSNCSTGFIWPIPKHKELENYYSNQYWGHAEDVINEHPIHHDTEYISDIIKKYSPGSKSICEVGCGPGTLLNGLKEQGYEVFGQEYSKKAAELGRKYLNLDIKIGSLSDLNAPKFDCVILRHMIEHSPDPLKDFKNAAEHVQNNGGILVLITPNYYSLAAQVFKRFWEWFVPPAHLFYFSLDSFQFIARQNNLKIAQTDTKNGDAIPILQAWSDFEKYSKIINDEWNREWLKNGKKLLEDLIQNYGSSILGKLGLGEELVIVFKRI